MNQRIASRAGSLLALSGLIAAAGWAFAPLAHPPIVIPEKPPERPAPPPPHALDIASFSAPIWVAPPPPPPAPPKPAATPPLRFELLAIVRDGESQEAIIYDLDADRIRAVRVGEPLGLATVDRIGDADITIRDHAGTRTVALAPPGGSP